jgi:hypothetical protein
MRGAFEDENGLKRLCPLDGILSTVHQVLVFLIFSGAFRGKSSSICDNLVEKVELG